MHRTGLLALLLPLLVSACGNGQIGPDPLTQQASLTTTALLVGSPIPWWDRPPGPTSCGTPAVYRIDSGQPRGLGDCAGNLITDFPTIGMKIGQELDLHMLTNTATGTTPPPPIYPLPASPDVAVLRPLAVTDNGATGRYLGIGIGYVDLVTSGSCVDSRTGQQTQGRCAVLHVEVTG
jgi:hypothetical protein